MLLSFNYNFKIPNFQFLYFWKQKNNIKRIKYQHFSIDLCNNIRSPDEYPVIMRESFKKALSEFNLRLLTPELPFLREILQDYLDKIKSNYEFLKETELILQNSFEQRKAIIPQDSIKQNLLAKFIKEKDYKTFEQKLFSVLKSNMTLFNSLD